MSSVYSRGEHMLWSLFFSRVTAPITRSWAALLTGRTPITFHITDDINIWHDVWYNTIFDVGTSKADRCQQSCANFTGFRFASASSTSYSGDGLQVSARTGATIPGCWLCAGHLGGKPTTSSICCARLPRCHWDKNYTWQKELRSHWSNNLEQSFSRSATPLAVTAVIWTKTETVFVWAMSAPEECRAIQMFALLLLLLLSPGSWWNRKSPAVASRWIQGRCRSASWRTRSPLT